ncbi:hypothetical protein O3P69_011528 [Scylla paramamosain]|uniref:Uncharacterized protein n=1 Tax=Scylla paramamosain TaxID=85552 RepID=A0AAW0T682_SCYPA
MLLTTKDREAFPFPPPATPSQTVPAASPQPPPPDAASSPAGCATVTLRPTPTQAVATLAARILKVIHAPQEAAAGLPHKRNSELINSLLGLSPLMNEAGRR